MSRVGKMSIPLPSGVTVSESSGVLTVKGPKGVLQQKLPSHTSVGVDDGMVKVGRANESKTARSNHGLMRALAANMVKGVTIGFSKNLLVKGIGYRADVRGRNLVMNLGYSHPIEYSIPEGVNISVDKNNRITIEGIDRALVGQVAANIRDYRKPDRYKGKGVRYEGEHIILKAGKSA